MTINLYLGVEDVLLFRTIRADGNRRGFAMARYALDFLTWAAQGFECHWLTSLDRRGGDARIRRAFRFALGLPALTGEIEILFECIAPTVRDMSMSTKRIDVSSSDTFKPT